MLGVGKRGGQIERLAAVVANGQRDAGAGCILYRAAEFDRSGLAADDDRRIVQDGDFRRQFAERHDANGELRFGGVARRVGRLDGYVLIGPLAAVGRPGDQPRVGIDDHSGRGQEQLVGDRAGRLGQGFHVACIENPFGRLCSRGEIELRRGGVDRDRQRRGGLARQIDSGVQIADVNRQVFQRLCGGDRTGALGQRFRVVGRDDHRGAQGNVAADQLAVGEQLNPGPVQDAVDLELQRVAALIVQVRQQVQVAAAGIGAREQGDGSRRGGMDVDRDELDVPGRVLSDRGTIGHHAHFNAVDAHDAVRWRDRDIAGVVIDGNRQIGTARDDDGVVMDRVPLDVDTGQVETDLRIDGRFDRGDRVEIRRIVVGVGRDGHLERLGDGLLGDSIGGRHGDGGRAGGAVGSGKPKHSVLIVAESRGAGDRYGVVRHTYFIVWIIRIGVGWVEGFGMDRHIFNLLQNISALGQEADDRIAEVAVAERGGGYEELRAVGVPAAVGQCQNSSAGELQVGVELIVVLVAWPAGAVSVGIAALGHEVFNHAMEGQAVVERYAPDDGVVDQGDDLIDCLGSEIAEELEDQIAVDVVVFVVGVALVIDGDAQARISFGNGRGQLRIGDRGIDQIGFVDRDRVLDGVSQIFLTIKRDIQRRAGQYGLIGDGRKRDRQQLP